jgi:methyltransferase (TIGR00027 family)
MNLQQPVPILRMLDEAKAREFYLDFLGFSIDFEHRFADSAPLYLQIRRSGCTIHLSEHYGDAVPGGALRITVDDVDALNRELLAKHYKYARPGVSDTPWRTREMTITDPFGNRLVFSQPVVATIDFPGTGGGEMSPVGLTAQWVAASRALETESENPLYQDPFARELAGPVGFAMNAAASASTGADAARPSPHLTIRTKFLDDGILAAVGKNGGLSQAVILAAGMDARAFRLTWPSGLTLFEVDRDDIFDRKEAILARLDAKVACDRRIVRADLARPWTEKLLDAGFDPRTPAAFLTEGLLMYLDEPSALRLLEAIRTVAAPGSWIGLDLVNTDMLTSPYTAGLMKGLAKAGCPWNFGVDDPQELLARYGWQATVASPGDPEVSYGRWPFPPMPRGMPGVPRSFFVKAVRTNG